MKTLVTLALRAFTDPGLTPTRLPAPLDTATSHLQSLALLAARLYVAQVFFLSGLTKLRDWSSTLALFNDIYQVPLLPPALAAHMGTAGELVLPVLLVLGLAGRFAGAGLFVVNLMAVLSLSADDLSPAAQAQHALWGVLALAVVLWGAGRWSVDRWLATRAA
ncbi:DoxX family protein [Roseateles asaccharophilus]|uniref:Oxidoreductase n=1 Tax=Roseateles asaccharophilus TaxID=582607 RepID=A0ABU2A5V0_9BURK|nr:DoxX family protein [Roseateles asaccharophilus]MDR7332515.1 putative oxidoreductase [Roseateles asaccharophilus]